MRNRTHKARSSADRARLLDRNAENNRQSTEHCCLSRAFLEESHYAARLCTQSDQTLQLHLLSKACCELLSCTYTGCFLWENHSIPEVQFTPDGCDTVQSKALVHLLSRVLHSHFTESVTVRGRSAVLVP